VSHLKFRTRLQKHGNSTAVTFSRPILEKAGLKVGDPVEASVTEAGIIEIRPAQADSAVFDSAFEWLVGRYGNTLTALSK